MDYNDLYRHLDIKKDLVTSFSILFSRFEYALKRIGDYAWGDENGAKANWDQFALDHAANFNSERTSELKAAVEFLKSKPPQKQILKDGSLDWKNVPIENTLPLKQILDSVRRVRNNLFHGGKFGYGEVEEPGRDSSLLQNCTTILEECLSLNEEVRKQFYQS